MRRVIVMRAQVYYNIVVSVACGESYEKQENEDKEKEEEDFGTRDKYETVAAAAVARGRRVRSERSRPRVCVQTRIPSRNLNNYLIYIWCPVAGRGRKSTNGRP